MSRQAVLTTRGIDSVRAERTLTRRQIVAFLAVFSIVSMALAAFSAYHVPPYMDEGTFSDAAHNLAYRGFMGTTHLETAGTGLTRLDRHTYWIMPLYLVGQAAWMRVVPPSLFGVRLFSVFWIPFSIGALYAIMRRLGFTQAAALAGAALDAISFVLIDCAKNARPDMMCQAIGYCGLAVYLLLRERSLVVALCAGNLLVALSGLTHPNGILYFAGLWLIVLWLDWRRLGWLEIGAAASVYLVAGAIWSIYILQDPSAFFDQLRGNSDHRFGGVSWSANTLPPPLSTFWGEIHDRYLVVFGLLSSIRFSWLKGLVLLTYIAALVAIPAMRLGGRRPLRVLLGLLGLFFLIQSTVNQKLGFYFVHIEPLYAAVTGVVIAALWSRGRGLARWTLAAWMILIVGIQIAASAGKAATLSTNSAQKEVAAFLDANARQAHLIFGSACLIHTVGFDPRYLDDRYLGIRSGKRADVIVMADYLDSDLYDGLRREKPDDWAKISRRMAEYRLVFARTGYRVYFDAAMPDPAAR